MRDKTLGIVLLVIAVILLSIVFYVNVSNKLDSLADLLIGEGLGLVCSSPEDCKGLKIILQVEYFKNHFIPSLWRNS